MLEIVLGGFFQVCVNLNTQQERDARAFELRLARCSENM